jgi:hypothetical protein
MSFLIAPILAQALNVSVGDRTETRVRSTDDVSAVDVVRRANATVRLTTPRSSWSLAYTPTLTLLAIGDSSASRSFLHGLTLIEQLRLSPRLTAQFSESASYGFQNFRVMSVSAATGSIDSGTETGTPTPPSGGATTPTQTMPALQNGVIDQNTRYYDVAMRGAVFYQLTRRWTESVFASYSSSAGISEASLRRFPKSIETEGGETTTYAVSRLDSIGLTGTVTRYEMPAIATVNGGTIEFGWSRNLSPFARGSLALDESFWSWKSIAGEERRMTFTGGYGSFTYEKPYHHGDRVRLLIQERVSPKMDRFLGTFNPQSVTTVSVGKTHERLSLFLSGNAIITSGTMARTSRYGYSGDVKLSYEIDRQVDVECGVRQSGFAADNGNSATVTRAVYLAISFSSESTRTQ